MCVSVKIKLVTYITLDGLDLSEPWRTDPKISKTIRVLPVSPVKAFSIVFFLWEKSRKRYSFKPCHVLVCGSYLKDFFKDILSL